jgi:small subunit ribosomal protein S1
MRGLVDEPTDGNEEDFAAMFAASERSERLQTGHTVEGTIVAIGAEAAFVDVGAKGEAMLALDELKNADGELEAAVGDRIQATVVSTTGGITLSRRLQRGAATARQLEDAFRSGLPVEGKVDGQVKGGYTVTIARQRAFCPVSQIDINRDTDPAVHLGRVYPFRIIEYRDGGHKFVVSRRALQEDEQRLRAAGVRESLVPGAVVSGQVVSVRDFGAFIDLGGGVQGLLHVSEMAWTRVSSPSEVVAPGQNLTVKVLKIDGDRIALSLKQLMADPWSGVSASSDPTDAASPATIAPGVRLTGTVERHEPFGIFVALSPGIVGLVPAAETGVPREADVARRFPAGTEVEVIVLDVDASNRRVRLSIKGIQAAEEAADARDYAARADADATTSFGSLADKLRGVFGPKSGTR